MRGDTMKVTTELVVEECCNCGCQFAMESRFASKRREDHEWWYCPAGHAQHYTAKTQAEKERDEARTALARARESLAFESARAERERASHIATKGQLTKLRNRVQHGVCPDCHRTFADLARHMAIKHGSPAEKAQAIERERAKVHE